MQEYLNSAYVFRKTWIFEEIGEINLRNKWHFAGREIDIARYAFNMPYISSLRNVDDTSRKTCECPLWCTNFFGRCFNCSSGGWTKRCSIKPSNFCGSPRSNFGPRNTKQFQKKSNKVTLLYSILLIAVSRSTCFGRNSHPSSGARLNCIYSMCSDSSTTTAGHTLFINTVNTVSSSSWWWMTVSPETCRATYSN
jgi:hypothetical protein